MSAPIISPRKSSAQPYIGLALSGGGARAMAFHLGCLRVLHDRGILKKVKVLSTVSGGSVIGACYAYSPDAFEAFDDTVVKLLRRGLQRLILKEALLSAEAFKIILTLVLNGLPTFALWILATTLGLICNLMGIPSQRIEHRLTSIRRALPIWGSLTTAFERALNKLFRERTLRDVARSGLHVVINACDLKTGTAFRFGSKRSGGWRYGEVVGSDPTVGKAVAASAAFPILLPPLVEMFQFLKSELVEERTVFLTDGGVVDNLGVAVLEPGRDADITDTYPVTHIISLNAGPGQFDGVDQPFWWAGRLAKSFDSVHRKSQDHVYSRLHRYVEAGELLGFGMVYLGQQDSQLPFLPAGLVSRDKVRRYPTDFSPMSDEDIELLSKRGEQLTQLILDRYLPSL